MKICFITAITGNYETKLREPIKQSIPTDFICFTNQPMYSDKWKIEPLKYHPLNLKEAYDVAKWYKLQFNKIAMLQDYDHVVWLDGSIEIRHKRCAEWVVNNNKVCTMFSHEWRNGILLNEALGMAQNSRYNNENPLYTINKYYENGFKETYFRLQPFDKNPDYGVWITCFVAWRNIPEINVILNDWWYEHLYSTKNDQLSLPYVLYKHKIKPVALPNKEISGVPHVETTFYRKYNHGT